MDSWNTYKNQWNLAQSLENSLKSLRSIVVRWPTGRRYGQKRALSLFSLSLIPPKMEKKLQFLALTRGQFCYFFKSNVFFVLPLRYNTENALPRALRLPKQSPVRKKAARGRCEPRTDFREQRENVLPIFWSKNTLGVAQRFFFKNGLRLLLEPQAETTCLRNFFEPQKK